MVKVLLVIRNPKESEILSLALQQKGVKATVSEPNYSNYLKAVQYSPDIIMIEMPQFYTEQLYFIRILKKNKKTAKIPIIGYGNFFEEMTVKSFFMSGFNKYYQRPLKFTALLEDMRVMLKGKFVTQPAASAGQDAQKRAEDIAFIMNKEKLPTERLEMMVNYVGKLFAFPFTIARILKITQDEASGANELTKAIKADANITATMLKISNSVLFASRDRTISNIKEAVVRLGFRETKNIALSMSIMKMFGKEEKNLGYNRMEFWYHSLACGVVAEKIAKNVGFRNPEEVFVAGLLHDFGILLIDEYFGEIFEKAMEHTTKHGIPLIEAEKEIIGLTHHDLIEKLFEKWNMPRHLTYGIIKHEDFTNQTVTEPLLKSVASILGISNIFVKAADLGMGCDQIVHAIPEEYFIQFKMGGGPKDVFFDDVHLAMNLYSQFLGLDPKTFPEESQLTTDKPPAKLLVFNKSNLTYEPHLFYLRKLGYPMAEARTLDELKNYKEPFHLMLINAGPSAKTEDLGPVLAFMAEKASGNGKTKKTPVLLFHETETPFAQLTGYDPLKRLPKKMDLRNIVAEIETYSTNP